MKYSGPWLTVDSVVFDERDRLLLVRRKNPPYRGQFALPGGFVENGETTEHAARRELEEETGVKVANLRLIGVYSDPGRDPRHHVVSVAYLALVKSPTVRAGDDAATASFIADWKDLDFAFDHRRILADALRLRGTP